MSVEYNKTGRDGTLSIIKRPELSDDMATWLYNTIYPKDTNSEVGAERKALASEEAQVPLLTSEPGAAGLPHPPG